MFTSRRRDPFQPRSVVSRLRDGASAVLLCAGLALLPLLLMLDMSVAVSCRNTGRLGCLQLMSRSMIVPMMEELGKTPE